MQNDDMKSLLRIYLIKIGIDFTFYGSYLIKEVLLIMLDESDILHKGNVFAMLADIHNEGIETIKKRIRCSINDACRRGVFDNNGERIEWISTRKAFILLYNGFLSFNA